jgi:hypothetical protein
MKYAILATGLMLAFACTGAAIAQTEVTKTTTTTTTISPEDRTTYQQWVVTDHHQSIMADKFNVQVGAVLPPAVTYYEVPRMEKYRYTIVNDHRVLVDPVTRQIVEVEQ